MRRFRLNEAQFDQAFFRRHFINSISGFKSANLVGTVSPEGRGNLSLFSSAVHIGANPPLIGLLMRPLTVERQTYNYIKSSGSYTINHVNRSIVANAHYCSAKFDDKTSEFEACELTEEYLDGHKAPYVGESLLKMGVELVEELPVKSNGTILLIGRIRDVYLDENALLPDGNIDLKQLDTIAVSGLESYYEGNKIAHFPFARPGQFPQNTLK